MTSYLVLRRLRKIDDPDYESLPYGEYDKVCTSYLAFVKFVFDAIVSVYEI